MKLTIIETPRATKTFGELKPGDVFRYGQSVYIKSIPSIRDKFNAVSVLGSFAWNPGEFTGNEVVEPLDAELIVRPLLA